MQAALFSSIFSTSSTTITLEQMGLTLGTSILLGLLLAMVYKYKATYSKEFVITLTLLPSLIAVIIFLVNGNLGTSVAVAGAFSLIRFRSAAGSSKELLAVFLATAIGLATGMGYLVLAIAVTILLSALILLLEGTSFGKANAHQRYLIVTVPKEVDMDAFLQDECAAYLKNFELLSLRYKQKKEVLVLEYALEVHANISDKVLIDQLVTAQPKDMVLHHEVPKKKRL